MEHSEIPNANSEKSNGAFGNSELHIRKNQPIEPAQLTREAAAAARAHEGVEKRIEELQAVVIRVTGLRVDNSYTERLLIEATAKLHQDGASIAEIEAFALSRRAPPKIRYLVNDFREWKLRSDVYIPDAPEPQRELTYEERFEIFRQKQARIDPIDVLEAKYAKPKVTR